MGSALGAAGGSLLGKKVSEDRRYNDDDYDNDDRYRYNKKGYRNSKYRYNDRNYSGNYRRR